jgi:ABC-type dipeptide/oligopeptide/nickel transport system permease subunit
MIVILGYVIVACSRHGIAPYGESEVFPQPVSRPGVRSSLGTDNLGRDMLTRLIYGARNTVGIALRRPCSRSLVGASLGISRGARGGWLDQLMSRLVDALMAIPGADLRAHAAVDLRLLDPQHDPDHRAARRDARLPPGPRGGDERRGDGLCRGGPAARRGAGWIMRREILPNILRR